MGRHVSGLPSRYAACPAAMPLGGAAPGDDGLASGPWPASASESTFVVFPFRKN
jgi:hypothetical protein